MKIVYFIESFDQKAGIERVTTAKANYFADEKGIDVTIVTAYTQDAPDSYQLSPLVHRECLNLAYINDNDNFIVKNANRALLMAKAISRFNTLMDKIKPDIIVYTWVLGAVLIPYTHCKAYKIYESHTPLHRIPFRFFQRRAAKHANVVVCLTNGDASEYKRLTDNVLVIPNFVDKQSSICTEYAVKRAIAVGRLSKEKGYDNLIKAWKIASEKHPDWTLYIYGEGEERKALEKQMTDLCIGNSIILAGNNEMVMCEYAKSSFQIMSSHYEGLPMTLIEGQTCGLACVSTNFKYGASDVIENGENGFLVPQDNVIALAEAITKMMADENLRQQMGIKAREKAKKYSAEVILDRWMQLFSTAK